MTSEFPSNLSNKNLDEVAEYCSELLSNNNNNGGGSGGSSLKETSKQLARDLIDRDLVSALRKITPDQNRVAVRDEMINFLLRQMTTPSTFSNSSNNNGNSSSFSPLATTTTTATESGKDVEGENTSNNNSLLSNNSANSSMLLPPGSENMASLINQGAVSHRGSAITLKRLLEGSNGDVAIRRTTLAVLAKVAESVVRDQREEARRQKVVVTTTTSKKGKKTISHSNNNKTSPNISSSEDLSNNASFKERAKAMELLKPTVLEIMRTDPAFAYECHFICRCLGWMELPSMNISSHASLGLVRPSHRNSSCYSVLAGVLPEYGHIGSFVATCSRDAPTIDIFRDVNISGDYAFSSFSVPQQFNPLSLVSLAPSKPAEDESSSSSSVASNLVALCCGVEASERVGLGLINLGDDFPMSSQTHHCDVREVFGISQPSCAVPMGIGSPAIAIGCAVPGGFGVTTVVVETTQRIHTYSSSSSNCISALTNCPFGGDTCIISGSRDGSIELWDVRTSPRGPTQSICGPSTSTSVSNTMMNHGNNNKRGGGYGNYFNNNNNNGMMMTTTTTVSDATTALAFLNNGSNETNSNLLVSGSSSGLVSIWDIRQGVSSTTTSSRELTSMKVDGAVLSIANIPSSSSSGEQYFAVSTTKSLSIHRLNGSNKKKNHSTAAAPQAEEDENEQQAHDDDGAEDENEEQNSNSNNRIWNNTSKNGLITTEQIIPCRTIMQQQQPANNNSNAALLAAVSPQPCLYHDLSVVERFAGGKHTYILAGSDNGIVEAFRVRCL